MVLGAGGAARAAIVGLGSAGARTVTSCARRRERASTLVADLAASLPCAMRARSLDAADLADAFASATVVVQATSATLDDGPGAFELADALPFAALSQGATVVDLVYSPRDTAVLRRARSFGLATVDGLGMLLHQGALAFERFTGREAPLEVMRAALHRLTD